MSRDLGERIVAARAEIDSVCQLLVSPSPAVLDRCSGILEIALSEISGSRTGPADTRLRNQCLGEAHSLASSLTQARRLLDGAFAFHLNWIRRLGELSSGYTGEGHPAGVQRSGHLAVQG